ncbi:MAG: ADP-ribosylglycohydrolase family protein, partial [Planctomycetota bacterium]
ISCRCGQDADCNPSNAAGVLGCMIGFDAIGNNITAGLTAAGDAKFNYTEYSFNNLMPACLGMAEKIAIRNGGKATEDTLIIPVQKPKAARFEQWTNQLKTIDTPISQYEMDLWNPGWKLLACAKDKGAQWRGAIYRRHNVLRLYPVSRKEPAVVASDIEVPADGNPKMHIVVTSDKETDYLLKVIIDDQLARQSLINTKAKWITETVDLAPYKGKKVNVRIETHATSDKLGFAYISDVTIKTE